MKRFSRALVVFMMLLLAAVAARVYASLPFGGDDEGFVPPDKNTAKCEDGVAKSLAHYLSCVLICHVKAANAALASQTFNEEMCEDGPTAKENSCLEKYQAAANKVLSKGICPTCLDITAMMSLTTQGETLLDNLNQVIYCGGAPTATPTPLATNTPVATNTPTCPLGQTNCGGSCVDTTTDANNCGGCGTVCPAVSNGTAGCLNGTCGVGSCNAGFADCDLSPANGCETNISSNVFDCGSCGHVCSLPNATAGCTSGTCIVASCNPGFANCDANSANGCEVSLNTDANNCGSCGNQCVATSQSTCGTSGTCSAGACQLWSNGTICAAQFCNGNVENQASTCDGSGTCVPGATINCAPYICAAGACKTSCASNTDCVSPATCSGSVCS